MNRSLMGVYTFIGGYTYVERNRRANIIPITLGPHSSNFEDVVKSLGDFRAFDQGIELCINGKEVKVVVYTMAFIGDMPQQHENVGLIN